MATTTRQQPPWQPPPQPATDAGIPPLKIWNSLTRSKTQFVPLDWKNRKVTWYACGPTVYDDAHLGHARNYVSTDIIRRILRDYFKFHVQFVMNITDVDDKIIVRGRQQHFLEEFKQHGLAIEENQIVARLAALEAYIAKNLPKMPKETPPHEVPAEARKQYGAVLSGGPLEQGVPGDKEAKIKMHIKTVSAASDAIVALSQLEEVTSGNQAGLDDILGPWLDGRLGSSIDGKDHSIFTKLTKKYENRFMEDVRALNCLDPDEVTRVTEYGPQIVEFVEKIQKNHFAYESESSVYFDIAAFEEGSNNYARLEPWNRNDTALQADAEGALTKSPASNKRSVADFALWKASKPGEPSWPSPWGEGRPGWHIECSAMASDKLGRQIDIHSGGIDLGFPHHDNELAQSEAYWLEGNHQHQHQWVNYFMHMGHLSLAGSKMSKSLKNFTTIRDALGRGDWTPRGLRIVFLLGGWKEGIEITDDLVKAGASWEEKLNNFFIRANDNIQTSSQINSASSRLQGILETAKSSMSTALCDSFNTPAAMGIISELISSYNSAEKDQATRAVTLSIAKWITSMVNIFGLNGNAGPEDESIGWSGLDITDEARKTLSSLSAVRDSLRRQARSSKGVNGRELDTILGSNATTSEAHQTQTRSFEDVLHKFTNDAKSLAQSDTLSKDVLQLCDRVRDVDLWNRGIYLEDRDGDQPALIRPVTKELLAAKEAKEEREQQKQKAKAAREREAASKADKGRLSHLEMYKMDDFDEWDEEGLPTKDKEGEEITKSRGKKLRKDWERQKKLHEAWAKSNGV